MHLEDRTGKISKMKLRAKIIKTDQKEKANT